MGIIDYSKLDSDTIAFLIDELLKESNHHNLKSISNIEFGFAMGLQKAIRMLQKYKIRSIERK